MLLLAFSSSISTSPSLPLFSYLDIVEGSSSSKYSTWGIRGYIQLKTSGYAVMYGSQGKLLPHVCLSASRIFKPFRFVGMIMLRL